jgi:hypothetical protein
MGKELYSERQNNLSFTIPLRGMRTIFARYILRLHAAKIGAANAKNKNFCRSLYNTYLMAKAVFD